MFLNDGNSFEQKYFAQKERGSVFHSLAENCAAYKNFTEEDMDEKQRKERQENRQENQEVPQKNPQNDSQKNPHRENARQPSLRDELQAEQRDELRDEISEAENAALQEDENEDSEEDLTYIPAKQGSAHYTVPLALFIVGFSCMMLSTFVQSFRVIPQVIALALIVAGVLLTTRFGLSAYEYSIVRDPSLGRSLVVTRLQGKYRREACRLPLSAVREVICEDNIPAERLSGAQRYTFCNTMFARGTTTVVFAFSDAQLLPDARARDKDTVALRLEVRGRFVELLTEAEKSKG